MVALERLGCDGNGASVGRIARSAGIGNGTVSLYCARVQEAILSLENDYIRWPNVSQRIESSQIFEEKWEMKGCVGVIDGTHVILAQRPKIDGEVYFTRKYRYAVNTTVVCDHKKRIIYYQIGHPGSAHDSTVFKKSEMYKEPYRYLKDLK